MIATFLFVHLCLIGTATPGHGQAERPPNLVLLIGDDHGWPYSGFMGDPRVRTPNLDALAASGTTFVNAQSPSSLCQPALRALLSGVHSEQWESHRRVVESVVGKLPERTEVQYFRTLPRELVRRGYLAWEGGKLWEGTYATAGFTHGLATFVDPSWFRSDGDLFGRQGWTAGTAMAPLDAFLDQAHGQPFFLWVAPLLPHVPYDAPPDLARPYAGIGLVPEEENYLANVSWLDAVLGAVVATLERRGLRDDTLIVYLSDNGKDAAVPGAGVGRGKGTLHELGFRTPLVFSWPGRIAAGARREDLVSTVDVPATLLDFASAAPIRALEGRTLRPALEHGVPVGRSRLVGRFRGNKPANDGYWVRTADWRYMVARDGREQLYAIAADPYETADVAAAHPDVVERLRNEVPMWQARLDLGRATLEVAGRVLDGNGVPLAGETLELTGRSTTGRMVRLRVLSAASGDFLFASVPQGSYAIGARRRAARLVLAGHRDRIPVPLPAGSIDTYLPVLGRQATPPRRAGDATIAGIVRGRDGEPVPGATVRVRGLADGRPALVVLRTDTDGRYEAANLPSGPYAVSTDGPQVHAATRVTAVGGEVRTRDLRATPNRAGSDQKT